MPTHSRTSHQGLWTTSLLVAGVALGCLTASASATAAPKPKREPQKLSNLQLREGLHVLQATKKTLESADHDYGGHRRDAVKAVSAAEHQLRLALQAQHKQVKPGGTKRTQAGRAGAGGKQREPQNISNLQLADAIVVLERTSILLEKADHDYGGHRAAAVRDLGGAIQQLKIALRFEKKTK